MPNPPNYTTGSLLDNPSLAYGLPASQSPLLNTTSHTGSGGGGGGAIFHGTWAQMQLQSPDLGIEWFTTDQEILYMGTGSKWLRMNGNPRDNWVTDYGAVPSDTDPGATVMTANVAAINATLAAKSGYTTSDAVFPVTPSGHDYWINDTITPLSARLIGTTGAAYEQFDRVFRIGINGTNISSGDPVILLTAGQSVELASLAIYGNTECVRVRNFALWHIHDCSMTFNDASDTNSSGLHVENAFWGIAERIGISCPAGLDHHGVLLAASFGEIICGVAETHFRDIIIGNGNIQFQNRCTTGHQTGQSENITFHNILTESIDGPIFESIDVPGVIYAHGLSFVTMSHCGLADIPILTGKSFLHFADTTVISNWNISNCQRYAQYAFKIDTTIINVVLDDGGGTSGIANLIDPASAPGNILGLRYSDSSGTYIVSNQGSSTPPVYAVSVFGEANPRWWVDQRGKVFHTASTAGHSSLNIPPGVAPTTPVNGDVWETAVGIFVRINNITRGPLLSPFARSKANGATTIDASDFVTLTYVQDAGATVVNAITGGVAGQIMVITTSGATVTTIADGGQIALAGSANFVFGTADDTLTLLYDANSARWRELSRSHN